MKEQQETTHVSAKADAVMQSLDDFNGIIGRIQEGLAEIETKTIVAKGKIDVHVALAEQRIDAMIQQKVASAMQAFQAALPNMDYVEKELHRRRKSRGYGGSGYDDDY
jgi:hypothetical protein